MKIGVVQLDCVPGDTASNTAGITDGIRNAAAESCDLVVLPEMADTGYDLAKTVVAATDWETGTLTRIASAAAEHRIHVVAGLAERDGDHIFNTTAVIDRSGQLVTRYRKVHLITAEPICEQNYVTPGDELCVFDVDGLRCGLMTCYDIRFPEMARALAAAGAELIIVPAAFPEVRIGHWNTLTEARAIENQLYLAACNRVGADAGVEFGGSSRVISPTGELLASLADQPGLAAANIDPTAVPAIRGQVKVWQDRRPDLYDRWAEPPGPN